MSLKSGILHFWSCLIPATKHDLKETEKRMALKLSELEAKLKAQGEKVSKIISEIEALKASLGDVSIPDAAQAALDNLDALLQKADDENPDAPPASNA